MTDIELGSQLEKYLNDHYGNLAKFYRDVSNGTPIRIAFAQALSAPDRYRLRTGGYFDALMEPTEGIGGLEENTIIYAIGHLEETEKDYPEDHPVWQIR